MLYSVSPRRILNTVGLKPSWNFNTLIPIRLAAMKWPSSCTKTSTPSTNANDRMVISEPDTNTSDFQLYPADDLTSVIAGPLVNRSHLRKGAYLCRPMRIHGALDYAGDARERKRPVQESSHSDLIRGIEDHRKAVLAAQRPVRECQAGEHGQVRHVE